MNIVQRCERVIRSFCVFEQRTINVSNASSVEIERVPAGAVYEVEFVARVPPNARSSSPCIVHYELQVIASGVLFLITDSKDKSYAKLNVCDIAELYKENYYQKS